MFRLDKEKNIELTDAERNYLKGVAKRYEVDLYGINIVRNSGLSWKKNVACFSILTPDTIYICADNKSVLALLPHIVHESVHRMQYQTLGFLGYCFCAFPLWRGYLLERDCYDIENKVRDLVQQYPNV